MRITPEQKNAIIETVSTFFGSQARVYLFGSRVDDNARGGDIDLFIQWNETHDDTKIPADRMSKKIDFLVSLKQKIGDQKIDLVIQTHHDSQKPIYQIAKEQGILLNP